MNNRIVLPELLDVLPPQDASALRSRRDLRRVNAWMRHPQIMARTLRENLPAGDAGQIAELGAGDGHFLLNVAQRLNGRLQNTQGTLVDRLNTVDPQILSQFEPVGWHIRTDVAEAMDWLRHNQPVGPQTVISNLFFHQFETGQLAEMLLLAANVSRLVIALEPRRSLLPQICGRLLWAIGCNSVTRHDAQISVRAGFAGTELSALWPDRQRWDLIEKPVGLFSHLFIARRKD